MGLLHLFRSKRKFQTKEQVPEPVTNSPVDSSMDKFEDTAALPKYTEPVKRDAQKMA